MSSLHDYQALYVHIPFCAKRCNYCDFETDAAPMGDPSLAAYVASLSTDITLAANEGLLSNIKTVYLGGGTPTFLGERLLCALIETLRDFLPTDGLSEFTVEANPESLSPSLLTRLAAQGVNRLSIGVQSFVDAELKILGRVHDAKTALRAVQSARQQIENISVDLMCGIPEQSAESWQQNLAQAVALGAQHVSVYPLSVEPGTPFARSAEERILSFPDEDAQAKSMEQAAEILGRSGFERYEVASYAQDGFVCAHNCTYWSGVPYLGLGRGAAGMRENAHGRERLRNGAVIETLSPAEALLEDLMLGLRMSRGVPVLLVKRLAASVPSISETLDELLALQLITYDKGNYQPTPRGWLLGNELFGRIWQCRLQILK